MWLSAFRWRIDLWFMRNGWRVVRVNKYLIGLNFLDYIEAESEEEAIEKFSEQYDIKEKFLFVADVITEEVVE